MVEGIQAAEVRHAEGTQGGIPQSHARLQDGVHVLDGGGAHVHDVQGFPQHGELDAVDDEAVDVLDDDGLLAQADDQLPHLLQILLAGLFAGDDLAQGQQVGRIQPVLTHKPFRMFTCLSNFGNVQARGVGCKQGFFGGDFRNFGKESLLNIHALHNTLYN